jgi:predicted metal-dependent hydrolase
MHPKTIVSKQSTSPAAERIRLALNLESVSLSKIPENIVEQLAEISEKKLSRFPRKLKCITDNKTTWGGVYYLSSCHFKVNSKMTDEEIVQLIFYSTFLIIV